MTPFQAKPGHAFKVKVSLPPGVRTDVERREATFGTGTKDEVIADAIEAMLSNYKRRREWAPIAALLSGAVTLRRLWDAYEVGAVPELLRSIDDADLDPLITEWNYNPKYVRQIRVLIAEGTRFPASHFTRKRISAFLAKLDVSGSTKNRYRAALSVFAGWLVEREVIDHNPIANKGVRASKENPSRLKWMTTEQAQKVCDAAPGLYRGLFALLYGAGLEISAALRATWADVDLDAGTLHAHGTKTEHRNRVVVVPEWAWGRLAHGRTVAVLGSAPLFPGITERRAWGVHKDAQEAVGLSGYTLHDARHTYAVNALKAGLKATVVAHQLGHKTAALVHKVYGRFVPDAADYQGPPSTTTSTTPKRQSPAKKRAGGSK